MERVIDCYGVLQAYASLCASAAGVRPLRNLKSEAGLLLGPGWPRTRTRCSGICAAAVVRVVMSRLAATRSSKG